MMTEIDEKKERLKQEVEKKIYDFDELQEKLVGRGIASALQVFRDRGMLNKAITFGRNKDKTLEQQLSAFGIDKNQEGDRIQLQYVDKAGNKLTLKQAYRELCWKFHGKMPSHKRQQK